MSLLICNSLHDCSCFKLICRTCCNVFFSSQTDEIVVFPLWATDFNLLLLGLENRSKICLSRKGDWKSIHEFDSTGKTLLGLGNFLKNSQFWNCAGGVAKITVDAERERSKRKGGVPAVTSVVLDQSLYPVLESARNHLKLNCDGILVHETWKTDLVNGLGCSDSAVIFQLPKVQATACSGS